MANEQHDALLGTTMPSQPEEAPTFSQSLVFPRYVVAEVYRRIERKLGLEGIRSDDDISPGRFSAAFQ